MATAFPVAKLGSMLIRQMSRPLIRYMKKRAADNSVFREKICIPMGVFYNNHVQRRFQDMSSSKTIAPLTEEEAIHLGVELYGEMIVFLFGFSLMFLEFRRQRKKREEKEAAQAEEVSTAKTQVESMGLKLNEHERSQEERLATLAEDMKELKGLFEKLATGEATSTTAPSLTPTLDLKLKSEHREDERLSFLTKEVTELKTVILTLQTKLDKDQN